MGIDMIIKNYFASGNTAQGFADYFASNLQGIKKVFLLKGESGSEKSDLLKSILSFCEENGKDAECVHNPLDPDLLDGVIIPDMNYAVADEAAVRDMEPVPGRNDEFIDFGSVYDSERLKAYKEEIRHIKENISVCYGNAHKRLSDALAVHDEWEKYYISNMDFNKSGQLYDEITKLLIGHSRFDKVSVIRHRFLGASTYNGPLDYIENLTSGLSKRYFLKGRPGTGKSTLLKKLVSECKERGINAEVYHCGFDVSSLDMVILPELNACIFDSTAPHLHEPSRTGDEIIDLYEKCVKPGTDEKYSSEIGEINIRYKNTIRQGIRYLSEAKELSDKIRKYLTEAVDPDRLSFIENNILKAIRAAEIAI